MERRASDRRDESRSSMPGSRARSVSSSITGGGTGVLGQYAGRAFRSGVIMARSFMPQTEAVAAEQHRGEIGKDLLVPPPKHARSRPGSPAIFQDRHGGCAKSHAEKPTAEHQSDACCPASGAAQTSMSGQRGSEAAGGLRRGMPQCGQSSAVGRYRAVTGRFDRSLPTPGAICRCLSRSKARSWPRSHGHLANVGCKGCARCHRLKEFASC